MNQVTKNTFEIDFSSEQQQHILKTFLEDTRNLATEEDVKRWLSSWLIKEIPALGGIKPILLLETKEGVERVVATLQRIAYSVYA